LEEDNKGGKKETITVYLGVLSEGEGGSSGERNNAPAEHQVRVSQKRASSA